MGLNHGMDELAEAADACVDCVFIGARKAEAEGVAIAAVCEESPTWDDGNFLSFEGLCK